MMAFIYRSRRKDEMYLFLRDRDDFEVVPEALRNAFGQAEFVMALDLASRDRLAREDIETVRANLRDQGFHLQMPPPPELAGRKPSP
jgi:hypothetical protein